VPRRLDLALGQPALDLGGGFDEFFASEYRGRFNGDGVVVAPPNDESVVFDYNGDDGIFEVQCAAGSYSPSSSRACRHSANRAAISASVPDAVGL
jgi:hypothetical protein